MKRLQQLTKELLALDIPIEYNGLYNHSKQDCIKKFNKLLYLEDETYSKYKYFYIKYRDDNTIYALLNHKTIDEVIEFSYKYMSFKKAVELSLYSRPYLLKYYSEYVIKEDGKLYFERKGLVEVLKSHDKLRVLS